ncbi:hypothetical protein I316_03217 [Kwoniella heveanensis BCC8398]|uniref:Uncharacterized protein n=1 Tax=Kwoniella heveanensis BCC8398 TaxID=1296120 RepID=A0A1B9GW86_9TREE|nr:hypothetical protein I316_03217 [Kwoniella heveanensis BCC8398]
MSQVTTSEALSRQIEGLELAGPAAAYAPSQQLPWAPDAAGQIAHASSQDPQETPGSLHFSGSMTLPHAHASRSLQYDLAPSGMVDPGAEHPKMADAGIQSGLVAHPDSLHHRHPPGPPSLAHNSYRLVGTNDQQSDASHRETQTAMLPTTGRRNRPPFEDLRNFYHTNSPRDESSNWPTGRPPAFGGGAQDFQNSKAQGTALSVASRQKRNPFRNMRDFYETNSPRDESSDWPTGRPPTYGVHRPEMRVSEPASGDADHYTSDKNAEDEVEYDIPMHCPPPAHDSSYSGMPILNPGSVRLTGRPSSQIARLPPHRSVEAGTAYRQSGGSCSAAQSSTNAAIKVGSIGQRFFDQAMRGYLEHGREYLERGRVKLYTSSTVPGGFEHTIRSSSQDVSGFTANTSPEDSIAGTVCYYVTISNTGPIATEWIDEIGRLPLTDFRPTESGATNNRRKLLYAAVLDNLAGSHTGRFTTLQLKGSSRYSASVDCQAITAIGQATITLRADVVLDFGGELGSFMQTNGTAESNETPAAAEYYHKDDDGQPHPAYLDTAGTADALSEFSYTGV